MEKEEYQVLYNIEDGYWWYIGLRNLVLFFIDKLINKRNNLRILDAGCGTGGVLSRLEVCKTYGFDISEEAIKFCKLRRINNLIKASICNIPFKNNSFDVILSLDVLCHLSIKNDIQALGELYRVLQNGGVLLLNLPAFDFLKSEHDKAVHTGHRYTLKEVGQKVNMVGFVIEKITYRNTFLFPLAIIKRVLDKTLLKSKVRPKSDLTPLPNLINKFFSQILFLENRLIPALNLPFGLSIFCVARKNK